MKTKRSERGFVALISVLIIAAILLVLIFTLGLASFFARFDALGAENKRISLGLADACINVALLHIAQNPTGYTGNELITIETGSPVKQCKICAYTAGNPLTLRAVYGSAYTNLQITVNVLPGGIVSQGSWTELASNPLPLTCTLP